MAITQAEILAASDADGAIVITGTVATAPISGSTAISLVPPSTAIPTTQAWIDEGHYLYIHDNGRTLHRITNVTAADGLGNQTVTVEFPFDSSEFRSYTRLDGTSFTNGLPTAGNEYSISITMNDLVRAIAATESSSGITTFSDGTPSGVLDNYWSVDDEGDIDDDTDGVGVMIPANTALVQESGTIVGAPFRNLIMNKGVSDSAIIRFGRLHPGDTDDANGNFYTSGSVEILDDEGVTSTSDLLTGEIGHSVQLIKGYASLTRSTEFDGGAFQFLRMYASEGNAAREATQACMLIDFELRGNIGVRIAGNDTFIQNFTYQNGVWRGLNLRISDAARTLGQLSDLKCRDSDGMFYQFWPVSGTETVIDGFDVETPNFDSSNEFRLVDNNGSGEGLKTLIVKNFDVNKWSDVEALSTQVTFCNGGSGTNDRVIAARDLNVSVIDSASIALDTDNNSKLFIYTPSSSTHADWGDLTYTDEITDGSGDFAEQLVHVRNFRNGGKRRFASTPAVDSQVDIEYVSETVPAKITTRSRRFLTTTSQNALYEGAGPTSVTNLMLDDPSHSDATFAAINLYTELDTAQKMYDYSKRLVYDAPQTVSEEGDVDIFSSLDSNNILTPSQPTNVILSETAVTNADDPQNLMIYNSGSSTLTVRVDTDLTGGIFDGGFDLGGTHDLSILNTISGYVNADNILLATGHNIVDGSTIINTSHTVNGEITLDAGTYYIDGGAIIDGLTISRSTGETEEVIIGLLNSNGSPTANTGVTIQEATAVTYQLDGDNFGASVLTYHAVEYSGDDDSEVTDGVTATITSDNAADTFTLTFDVATGNYIQVATWYLGYKNTFLRTTQGDHTVTMVKYAAVEMDTTAITVADAAVVGTPIADYNNETTWAYTTVDGRHVITAPDTSINIPDAAARDLLHRAIGGRAGGGTDSSLFVQQVAKGVIAHNVIDFDLTGVVVKAGDFGVSFHNDIQINHVASSTDTFWSTQVLDTENIDRSVFMTTATTDNKVRFSPKATNVFVGGDIATTFAGQVSAAVKPDLINLGLGVPLLNDAGDAFETTPNLPS